MLLVSMITMVAVVGVSMKERPYPTWPEKFLRDTVGFFQYMTYKPARSVAGFFENINEMKVMYTENERLKENLEEHAKLMARIRDLEAQNESLQQLLDVESDLTDYQLRPAEVVMRSPDRWYQHVTINMGETHGIEPNMAVITPQGLVGRVKSVSQLSSIVELLTDGNRNINVSAIVQGQEEVQGIIEGYDVEREALNLRMVRMDAPLEEGQTVITSGLGGVMPRGLFIGEVIDVIPDDYGLTQTALVKPAANIDRLDYVYVVERDFLPELDLSEEDEEGQEDEDTQDTEEEGA